MTVTQPAGMAADTSGVDGIDLYADVEDFNDDIDAPGGKADGSNPGRQFNNMNIIRAVFGPFSGPFLDPF